MTTVYFVRHAQPNYENHNDRLRELTPKGLEDRKLVTACLEKQNIHAVFSSPYKRAVDTVKEFADLHHLQIQTVEDFRERKVGSGWIQDFDAFARRQWSDFSYKLTGGESLEEVRSRNIKALQALLDTHRGKNIVIGTHGTALCTILHHYDPSFGYEDFIRIRDIMPWVVRLEFDDIGNCVWIRYDPENKL